LYRLAQNKTPLFDALKNHISKNIIPFHVPGHKQGKGISEFREFVGDRVLQMDLNGMEGLDFANNPTGVIFESEKLLAEAYGAQTAHFLVNGTSSGIHGMIMSSCDPGDKIIMPRNAHRSTIGAIILSGAIPIYIQPEVNEKLGIAMGISEEALKKTIKENPHTKALFIINPTYYGYAPDLKSLVRIAHRQDMSVLVDEAHGAHLMFHDDFPLSAMEVGADMSAASTHKTVGSMTQSAILLARGNRIASERIKEVLRLSYTTSASYVLMASIDVARKQMALHGSEIYEEVLEMVRWAREEINNIDVLYAFGKDLVGTPGCHDFDETKLGIHVHDLGMTGYEMEYRLRKDYNIQVELSDTNNVLAITGVGDCKKNLENLVLALQDIANSKTDRKTVEKVFIPQNPPMIVSPRDAFYSPKKVVPISQASGEIAGEMVMVYPPGIPLVCMGEKITDEILDYIKFLKEQHCELQGTVDSQLEYIRVLGV